jgi:hypothetical protein
MSLELVPAEIASTADLAHSRLREAIARLDSDRWAIADAIHAAHELEAWRHDDGEHVGRYQMIMQRQGMTSIFEAYVFDEFDIKRGYSHHLDRAGRLRAAVDISATNVAGLSTAIDWRRFSVGAVRSIDAGVLNSFHAEDIASALVDAQQLASQEAAKHPKAGRNTSEYFDVAPVTGRHVAAALVERGLVVQRPDLGEEVALDAARKREAKLARRAERAADDLAVLITERQRKAVTNVIVGAIRRLADHPKSLAEIRLALDEVTG